MDASKTEKLALLNEYLSMSSFLIRQVRNHSLKPKDYDGIVKSLMNELDTTRQGLSQTFQNYPDKRSLISYVEKVISTVEKVPKILDIISKHPNGNADVDERAAGILDQLAKLRMNLIHLGKNSSL